MFLGLLSAVCAFLALSFQAGATVPSPKASSDLICHTNRASECYPKAFQPTENFQLVHDDQELPAGLHTRVNLATGKKEARLNIKEEGEDLSALAILSSTDVILTDQTTTEEISIPQQNHGQKLLMPGSHGSIRPTTPNSGESETFSLIRSKLLTTSSVEDESLLPTLENLEDLSHDIYWGLKVAEDSSIVRKLMHLLQLNDTGSSVKGAAALAFGTAVQNNPAAFAAALSHCYNDELPSGPMEAVFAALLYEQLPQLLTRFVYLLSSLCQDHAYLWRFINAKGLDILIALFDAKKAGFDEKDRLRGKIANFILDHLLQQDSLSALKAADAKTESSSATPEEVTSELEHEDPWILSHDFVPAHTWSSEPIEVQTYRNMAQTLKPWCVTFSDSLKSWNDRQGAAVVVGKDNVIEANKALQKRLTSWGCSCSTDCGPVHRGLELKSAPNVGPSY